MLIKGIECIDLKGNTGSVAEVISGGIGFNNATIRLTSERGSGMKYRCTLFGKIDLNSIKL